MQFGLRTLFLVFFVLATAFAAFGPAGFLIAPWLVAVAVCFRIAIARRDGAAAILGIILLVGPLFVPVTCRAGESSRRSCCQSTLTQIGIALSNYADRYGCLPPAIVADANGRPMCSWRVLLLPYVEENGVYVKYRFDEPWDGPNNQKLATTTLAAWHCPSQPVATDDRPAPTHFVAITGPDTAWPGDHGCPARAIEDPANTILLVEVDRSDIAWCEPRDLAIDDVIHDEQGLAGAIGSRHGSIDDSYFVRGARGGHVLTADGMSHYLA
ncbi:MAG: DUF1559 domain-containing protein, partial [Pirellulales bacterium]|nr:DUF1559 domain-containing protein [Pirellulales bacterium]